MTAEMDIAAAGMADIAVKREKCLFYREPAPHMADQVPGGKGIGGYTYV